MKVEFYYFDGCPSYRQSLKNLREVLADENMDVDLELINVDSLEKAEEVGFQGSPSIKINGKDLDGRDGGFSYSCRIYRINGGECRYFIKRIYTGKNIDTSF